MTLLHLHCKEGTTFSTLKAICADYYEQKEVENRSVLVPRPTLIYAVYKDNY